MTTLLAALLPFLAAAALAQTTVAVGGTPVIGGPSQAVGNLTPSTCSGTDVSNGIKSDGTVHCVTPTAQLAPNANAQLGTVTTIQSNSTAVVDQATTGTGGNGFANVLASGGACVGSCDIMASPVYVKTDLSSYFLPAKDGDNDKSAAFPGQGVAVGQARFSEDRRSGNRYWTSINSQPMTTSIYSDRTPFVFEHRVSNSLGYGANTGAVMIRLRSFGAGHNYPSITSGNNTTQKTNFAMLALNGRISNSGQGGGLFDLAAVHASHGDLMHFTVATRSFGHSEGEDERTKLFRVSIGTALDRWGGNLTAAPTLDAASFGKWSLRVNQASGYNIAEMAGEDLPLVNLSRLYSGSSANAIQTSIYPGFAKVPISDGAAVASAFGTSTFTTLTADISNVTYDGNCPSTITNAAPLATDPMIVNEQGVGGRTVCASFGSTSGMTAGDFITLGGLHSNFEMPRVVSVADSTHAVINVQKYHASGEAAGKGGARGTAFGFPVDDIAPGTMAYGAQMGAQGTTLHKFFYVLGNDASNLYVYFDGAAVQELSTRAYLGTTPTTAATLGAPVLSGTALVSIPVTSYGNYSASAPNNIGQGQAVLSAPVVTIDPGGSACSVKPTATVQYVYAGYVWQVVGVTINTPGTCSSVPAVALQSVWTNPYRLAPATVTTKVVDPANGSPSSGYLLTDSLDPSKWQTGDLVEIPNWIHDQTGPGTRSFGKYFTGASANNGFIGADFWYGNYAGPDTLYGEINGTPSWNYYADSTHPFGPGVAYEVPPDLRGVAGNFGNFWHFHLPPQIAIINVDCVASVDGVTSNDPCVGGNPQPYDLAWLHMNSGGRTYSHHLTFDPTTPGGEAIVWDNLFHTKMLRVDSIQPGTPAVALCADSSGNVVSGGSSGLNCFDSTIRHEATLTAGSTSMTFTGFASRPLVLCQNETSASVPICSTTYSGGVTTLSISGGGSTDTIVYDLQLAHGAAGTTAAPAGAYAIFDANTLSGTAWADSTGNGYTMTAGGAAPTVVANAKGSNSAVQFDGSSTYFNLATGIPCQTTCSFYALYKPTVVNVKQSFTSNVTGGGGGSAASLTFAINSSGNQAVEQQHTALLATDSTALSAGTWYRLAMTYSGGTVSFHLNGVAGSTASASVLPTLINRFGSNTGGGPEELLNGQLSWAAFYPGPYNAAVDTFLSGR